MALKDGYIYEVRPNGTYVIVSELYSSPMVGGRRAGNFYYKTEIRAQRKAAEIAAEAVERQSTMRRLHGANWMQITNELSGK